MPAAFIADIRTPKPRPTQVTPKPNFAGIDGCKFRRPVVPGDQLRLEVTVQAHKGPVWKMHGEAFVDGALIAKGDMTATIPEPGEPTAGGGAP